MKLSFTLLLLVFSGVSASAIDSLDSDSEYWDEAMVVCKKNLLKEVGLPRRAAFKKIASQIVGRFFSYQPSLCILNELKFELDKGAKKYTYLEFVDDTVSWKDSSENSGEIEFEDLHRRINNFLMNQCLGMLESYLDQEPVMFEDLNEYQEDFNCFLEEVRKKDSFEISMQLRRELKNLTFTDALIQNHDTGVLKMNVGHLYSNEDYKNLYLLLKGYDNWEEHSIDNCSSLFERRSKLKASMRESSKCWIFIATSNPHQTTRILDVAFRYFEEKVGERDT